MIFKKSYKQKNTVVRKCIAGKGIDDPNRRQHQSKNIEIPIAPIPNMKKIKSRLHPAF
jgi:hypothetical protein